MFDGKTYHYLFAGLEYDLNPSLDLYFNLMYAEMDCAFKAGAEIQVFGQTADDFKTRLGCHQERRFFYVASTGRVAGLILGAAGAFLMPEPPRWAAHHVFRDPDSVPLGRCREPLTAPPSR